MPKEGNDIVEEIKSRCNIVDVIGKVVPLKKAGSNYKGLCPFHNEKTPSFNVSEKNQFYHCFGCGKSGDVFTFVQEYYNLDFLGALEKLAEEYGIEIKESFSGGEDKNKCYEMNLQAARYFYKAARGKDSRAIGYMTARGISDDTLKKFGIGWADEKWDSLTLYLKSLGYKEKDMDRVGLISMSKGKVYDKFRSRVIFPIQNTRGKMIGFGGRIVDRGEPKYLNSPESPVFRKKDNLYALNITGSEMSKSGSAILVEGYMDVISLYDRGVKNVTASLGTSLTEGQARLIKRYSPNVVIAYDGDAAGVNAAMRATDILYKEGCRVKVIYIDDGKDPDEFIKENGTAAFMKKVDKAPGFVEYKFDRLLERHDMDSTEERVKFLKEATDVLKVLRPTEREVHIKELAKRTGISEGAIRNELDSEETETGLPGDEAGRKVPVDKSIAPSLIEKTLISVMVADSALMEKRKQVEGAFTSYYGREIYDAMEEAFDSGGTTDPVKIGDGLSEEGRNIFDDITKNIPTAGAEEEIFSDCLKKLDMAGVKREMEELQWKISMAEEDKHRDDIDLWSKRLMELQKKMNMGENK